MKFRVEKARDKQAVVAYLDRLPEGKAYDVTVVRHRERRSVDQNRLLWLWIQCISDETGQDKDDLHEYFKQKFLGFDTKTLWGTTLYCPVSISALDSLRSLSISNASGPSPRRSSGSSFRTRRTSIGINLSISTTTKSKSQNMQNLSNYIPDEIKFNLPKASEIGDDSDETLEEE